MKANFTVQESIKGQAMSAFPNKKELSFLHYRILSFLYKTFTLEICTFHLSSSSYISKVDCFLFKKNLFFFYVFFFLFSFLFLEEMKKFN